MDKKIICPFIKQACIEDGGLINNELCGCPFWLHVRGKDPQSGEEVDNKGCAISWIPILLIENSKEQRTTGHEISQLRNEIMPQQQALNGIMGQLLGAARSASEVPRQTVIEVKDGD